VTVPVGAQVVTVPVGAQDVMPVGMGTPVVNPAVTAVVTVPVGAQVVTPVTDCKNRQTRGTRGLWVVHGMSRWVGACLRQTARIDKQEGPVAFGLCTGGAGGSGPVSDTKQESTDKRDPWPSGCAREEQVGWGLSQTQSKNRETRGTRGLWVVHGRSRWVGACLRHKARIEKQEGPVAFGLCTGRAGGLGPVSDTKQASTDNRDPWPSGCAREEQVGRGLSQLIEVGT
jgi:hypothetical protein